MNQKRASQLVARSMGLFSEPSLSAVESACNRVHARLITEVETSLSDPAIVAVPTPVRRRPLRFLAATVSLAVVTLLVGTVFLRDGTVTTVSMDQIATRQVFYADGKTDRTLVLPDDSRVEMRVRTELSFDRVPDGLRILLRDGSILVYAAKQRSGHLYVKTKDVTVSVVGTVFLVKTEQQGSRVAVIEGEVRVQSGTMSERLLPGEQLATNSMLSARPVIEEVSWSSHAEEHFASLEQSPIPPVAVTREPRDTFEVASIRSRAESPAPGSRLRPCPGGNAFEMTQMFQLNPGRVVIRQLPLYYLIGLAYGQSCPTPDALVGGPDWTRTTLFYLEATIPSGTPSYTKQQLLSGNAPLLQRMLQNLLADRFKLVLKREVKETPGYHLVVRQEGKLKLSADQTPDQFPADLRRPGMIAIPSVSAPISRLATILQQQMGRPVIDQTGLSGLYDVWLEFPEIAFPTPGAPQQGKPWIDSLDDQIRDLLPSRLETTTGLKLEAAKVPIEVMVIVSADMPSEN